MTIPAATVASTPEACRVLGDEERAEGGDRRQRGFDEMIVRGSGDEHRRDADDERRPGVLRRR